MATSTSISSLTAVTRNLETLFARSLLRTVGGGILPAIDIRMLRDDSRAVERGDCFVAVKGVAADGHAFIAKAIQAGAVAVVAQDGCVEKAAVGDVPLIEVEDSRVALARLSAAYHNLLDERGQWAGPGLIGVTGTNGKTTISWMVRSILATAGKRAGLMGTIGYDLVGERRKASLTTPGPLELSFSLGKARQAGAELMVLEVSSHALDQRRCDGLRFAVGVFTNLSGDHLDYHKTMSSYLAAKRRLFEMLDNNALAVINVDDEAGRTMAEATRAEVVTYGLANEAAEVRAEIKSMDAVESRFFLRGRNFEAPVRLSLVGKHNIANALAAAATAEGLGIDFDAIVVGLEGITGVPGRLERVTSDLHPACVYVDYAHTDDALDNVLGVLKPLTKGRLICLFGCGGDRDRTKRPRMAQVAARYADVVFVTSDNPRTEDPKRIIDDILEGFPKDSPMQVEIDADRGGAIKNAVELAGEGDVVLIAGKGHEDYQLVGERVLHFDDREIVRACMDGRTGDAEDAA